MLAHDRADLTVSTCPCTQMRKHKRMRKVRTVARFEFSRRQAPALEDIGRFLNDDFAEPGARGFG